MWTKRTKAGVIITVTVLVVLLMSMVTVTTNNSYTVTVKDNVKMDSIVTTGSTPNTVANVNVYVELQRFNPETGTYSDPEIISSTHNLVTTLGLNNVRNKLTNINGGANATKWSYIAVSNSNSSVSAAWTVLPLEITDHGLTRVNGTISNQGNGAFRVDSGQWTFTAPIYIACTGLYTEATAGGDGHLMAAAAVNTPFFGLTGDKLRIYWDVTATSS